MDGLKLDKWRENFNAQVQSVQIKFDAFFLEKQMKDYYELKVDESENLSLVITDDSLPHDIKNRLIDTLMSTKPEDSI